MMGHPLAVEAYAEMYARELHRRRRRDIVFAWLAAVVVALVLTGDWWIR